MTTARAISRERTAISRDRLSVPARRAVDHGVITNATSVLDYGCGRGDDVRHLQSVGITAAGWDPHYCPEPPPTPADVVLLTYVLNVIDDLDEREQTLRRATQLARQCLVVSTRLRWDNVPGADHIDGVVTSRNTFQALHRPREFRLWVELITGIRPLSGGPETAYVFTSSAARLVFVHRTFADVFDVDHRQQDPLRQLVGHLERHGRMPTTDERPQLITDLTGEYGTLPRARRAAEQVIAPSALILAARRRTADLVVALAMDTFHGRPKFADLPPGSRADIRAFFGTYIKAYRTAEHLLQAAGQPAQIGRSIRSAKTGKITPTSLYVHGDAIHRLPAILRIYEACAQVLAGRPADTTIIRLRHDAPIISYLSYPTFDTEPHPEQRSATQVDIGRLRVEHVDHTGSPDPPLLHRREEFVAQDHPKRAAWSCLTAKETAAGLFDRPDLIGRRSGWRQEVDRLHGS